MEHRNFTFFQTLVWTFCLQSLKFFFTWQKYKKLLHLILCNSIFLKRKQDRRKLASFWEADSYNGHKCMPSPLASLGQRASFNRHCGNGMWLTSYEWHQNTHNIVTSVLLNQDSYSYLLYFAIYVAVVKTLFFPYFWSSIWWWFNFRSI